MKTTNNGLLCWKRNVLIARPKITELRFHLFARNVHPELFQVCAQRTYTRDAYELHLQITSDGHLIYFTHDSQLLAEVSAGATHPLPTQGILLSQSLDRACQNSTRHQNISYQSSFELELIKPRTFATIQRQLSQRPDCEGLVHQFESNGRLSFGALSYMHVQSFQRHVLVRSLHTFPETCMIMKIESRFSID